MADNPDRLAPSRQKTIVVERIAIAGLSLRQVDVAVLEEVKRNIGDERSFARRAADELGASELVLLSTCNRAEVVFAREEGHLPCEADRKAIARLFSNDANLESSLCFDAGLDAARRLFRIVCSLESLVVGEDQILAQARAAHARSENDGLCGSLLTPLFNRAFQVGKEVRTATSLSRHPVSVVSIGLARLSQQLPQGQRDLAVIGAGAMAQLAITHAQSAGFRVRAVASRRPETAARLAEPLGAQASSIEDFLRSGPPVHALVSATRAPGIVVTSNALKSMADRLPAGECLAALDLAIPRDLEACDDPRVTIFDLEGLRAQAEQNRKARESAAAQAEVLIEQKLESLAQAFLDRGAAKTVAEMHGESREILERELSSLSDQRFSALSGDQRRAVEEWARQAFGRLEHAPIRAIKRWLESQRGSNGTP